ncbi:Site-specific DNA-cytosine methylase [Kitasatospora sp. MMS16-BH015]|uniref:DNA cytosine methyltransferase n=1 Tax=Kitasatospora sp. MMS16-BH015 TaxID=2018025 RepID=UPI000CA0EE80|nr:Site-specific DNA-cytosine methylase [Kitasatospora sp. MMS16-BH015]
MSFLYPRLLAEQAAPLFEEYRRLTIAELTGAAAFSHESAVYVATGGDRVPADRLRELRAGVVDLAKNAGFPDESDRARNAEFDLRLAALLHAETGMVPAEAASRDVWAFLALVVLPDVAFWRYPQPPKDRVLGTDLTRHVFGRLWWRAQLVRSSDDPEPYGALKILGEAAFDQIYARRAALGGSPHLVRAILRVWKDLDLAKLNEREALRDFLKRLLRLAPFVLFDGIEEWALDAELRAVAEESVTALKQAGSGEDGEPEPLPHTASEPAVLQPSACASSTGDDASEARREGMRRFTSLEICAGAGAQALGLERAGFDPVMLIDRNPKACATIRLNRPGWDVRCLDIVDFDPLKHPGALHVDLLTGGLPRIKSAGAVRRTDDTEARQVLTAALRLVTLVRPKALLLENLADIVDVRDFATDRAWIESELARAGYRSHWAVLDAVDFGVPQNRRSGFLVALPGAYDLAFSWPQPTGDPAPTVGEVLRDSMAANGWDGAEAWSARADRPAPALVGGSENRGGADLGPTGSKRAWAALGVDGNSLADEPPSVGFPVAAHPKLTVRQAATIQAIPDDWSLAGGKTSEYRQVGHALPPPLAEAVGRALAHALGVGEADPDRLAHVGHLVRGPHLAGYDRGRSSS